MASNYWASTQHNHWECTKDELQDARRIEQDPALEAQFPLPDRRFVSYFIQQQIAKLGRRMSVRQIVLATAHVFVCRFYVKVDIRRTNPFLLLTTAFYLACKIEESPHHIRLVVSEARNQWPDFVAADTAKVGECEFQLISVLNSQLIVHHPYTTLERLQASLSLSNDEMALAWSIVNDSYVTDLLFLDPPYVVALASIVMALVARPSHGGAMSHAIPAMARLTQPAGGKTSLLQMVQGRSSGLASWMAQSDVDVPAVIDAAQTIISWYVVAERYDEKVVKEGLVKIIKARGLEPAG